MTTDTRPIASEPARPDPPPSLGEAAGRVLRIVAVLVLVVAIVAGGLSFWSWMIRDTEETVTHHPAVDRVTLDLEANGAVEVRVHDLDEIVVRQRNESILAAIEGDQRVVDDVLHVSTERCGPLVNLLPIGNRCSASFVVTVPADTEVVGTIGHGRMQLEGLAAPVDLRTGHGEVEAVDVDADTVLRTGHGDVSVVGATGDVVGETGHGDIDLSGVVGAVEASTGHGAIGVRHGRGDLDLTTGHGAIDVAGTAVDTASLTTGQGGVTFAPNSAPTSIRIVTSHGSVRVPLPADAPPYAVTTDAEQTNVEIATDPGAEHRLDVTTGHGTIDIVHGDW